MIRWMAPLFRAAGWGAVLVIAVLSLVPGAARPHVMSVGQLEHVLAYLVTAALLRLGYPTTRSALIIAVWLPIYSALLEIAQLWVPGRTSQVIDALASAAGAWFGIVIATGVLWLIGARTSKISRF